MFLIVALSLPGLHYLASQSFQKEYAPANGGFVIPYSAALRPDGKFLVSHMVNDDSIRLYVTCLEPDGTVAWSVRLRAHLNITGNEGFLEGPIAATGDNGCIVMVSKSYQSQVVQQGWALLKLGPDGAVQWNLKIAGVGLHDDFLECSGGRTYVAARYPPALHKRYLCCLTNDGIVLWEKDLSLGIGAVAVSNIQALPGQRIVLMLNTEDANLSAGHLTVLDDSGNIANLLSLPGFSFMHAKEHPDGRLFFLGNTKDKVVLGLLQAGQLQWAKVLDLPADMYFSGAMAFNDTKDSLFVSFQGARFEEQRLMMQFDLTGGFSKGHYLPSKEVTVNQLIETPDSGLAWVAFSKTKPLRAFVFTKTDAGGRLGTCPAGLLCQLNVRDTVLQSLPTPAWVIENVAHISVQQATGHYQTLNVSDYCAPLPVFNAGIQTADSTGCAGDAFVFRRDSLTTGASAWIFPQGIPNSFYGPEPPVVTFPDTGNFKVRHILEQAGCRDTAWVNIQIKPQPEVVLPPDTLVCPGSAVSITAGGDPDWLYRWNDGTTVAARKNLIPGTYTVTVTNQGGCTNSDSMQISAVDFPQDPLPADTFFCENKPVFLEITVPAGWQYNWVDGVPGSSRVFSTGGIYILQAESPEGCQLADSVRVEIAPCPECFIYFPNIIKPGSGGENGFFGIHTGCNALEYSLQIFDRWGGLVFESDDPSRFWDGTYRGKTALPGVYVFQAKGVLENGNIITPFEKGGSVAVIR